MKFSLVIFALLAYAFAEVIIGIDLGTTYSAVSVSRNGQTTILPNELGLRITPSWVAFTESGERIVGDGAKAQATTNPTNTIYDVKRLIGRRFADAEVQRDAKMVPYKLIDKNGVPNIVVDIAGRGETVLAPEEISAMVLQKLKQQAEDYLGEPVSKAVITVPAYFKNAQREATRDAGIIAGLQVERILNEPTAAAIAYGLDKKGDRNILVYDLGGGTFDVSLLTISDGLFEVLATNGDTHLGGSDFDHRITEYLVGVFKRKHDIDLSSSPRAMARLRAASETAKRTLSTQQQARIELDALYEGIDFSETLTRAKFEDLNADLFKKTLRPVQNVLKDAKLSKSEVDDIVLVGGSTRIPKVQQLLTEFFNGRQLHKSINPDEAVAFGAAVQGAVLAGERDDVILVDTTPLTLGIETTGGVMAKVVPRNTNIPVRKSQVFTTAADNQSTVTIKVYEGERAMTGDNNLLGTFDLNGIPPAPRGTPQIEVTFNIDANGILEVTAEDKATGTKQSVQIKADAGHLSKEEIERMLADAEQFAEEDKMFRERVEARQRFEGAAISLRDIKNQEKMVEKLTEADLAVLADASAEALKFIEQNPEATLEELKEAEKALMDKTSSIMQKAYQGAENQQQQQPEFDDNFFNDEL